MDAVISKAFVRYFLTIWYSVCQTCGDKDLRWLLKDTEQSVEGVMHSIYACESDCHTWHCSDLSLAGENPGFLFTFPLWF